MFWVLGAQNKISFRVLLPIVCVRNSNLTFWLLPIFGPNSYFATGIMTILGGPMGPFGISGSKSNFIVVAFFLLVFSQTKIYSGALAHLGVHWGLLGFRGSK
jgi:hypothetical protein